MDVIITLTSIPSRFSKIELTLQSILSQKRKPDAIILYIPRKYKRFPEWDGSLRELHNVSKLIEIIRVDEDFGPATKILPAINSYKNKAVKIIYCDDDRFYPQNWLEQFLSKSIIAKNMAICNSGWSIKNYGINSPIRLKSIFDFYYNIEKVKNFIKYKISTEPLKRPERRRRYFKGGIVDVAEGYGGVMVEPRMFPDLVFNVHPDCWMVDDVWLSGMLAVNGFKIYLNPKGGGLKNHWLHQRISPDALHALMIDNQDRYQLDRRAIKYFQEHFGIFCH
jgi:hypothetical protein